MRSPTEPMQATGRRPSPAVALAAAVLLAGPVALAFASGAFFDGPRDTALVGMAVVALVLALAAPARDLLPASAGVWAALAGLVLWTGWVALSRGRSVVPDVAGDDAERVLLYAGFLAAGSVAWRRRALARIAEPAVAAGVLVVLLYGLAGRWLPGVVELQATASAGGRLEQPLTYWNATGMLAALGAVLCARLAGDPSRRTGLRAAAAAAVPPLLCGVYLSFSRGALAALVAGGLVLLLCAPTRAQLRAVGVTLLTGAVAVAGSALLPGVRALDGDLAARERDGLVAFALTVAMAVAAGALTARAARAPAPEVRLRVPRAARWVAAAAIVLAVVGPVLVSRNERAPGRSAAEARFGATTQRFASVSSNRYAYWSVALRSFSAHPVLGVGSGGWAAEWLRERSVPEAARDAHSIELETLAELGLIGFALLLLTFGGIARCAVAVQRRDPELAAGACAALTVWLAHATIDWDWEMPAVTLPALTLAAVLLARTGAAEDPA